MVSEFDRLLLDGSYEEFQAFVQRNPHVIREQCPDSGALPIHRVVSFDEPIVRRKRKFAILIEYYPEGLTIKDNKGRIPLHLATDVPHRDYQEDDSVGGNILVHESVDLLAFVLGAFPAALQFRDLNGNTPLEYAIIKKNFDHATYLLKNFWGVIQLDNESGDPILHAALENDAPPEFVRLLISKEHRCAQIQGYDDDLPLHTCIYLEKPFEVVEMILKAYPEALEVRNSSGHFPLCLELEEHARYDVVSLFVEKYPEAAGLATGNGSLPIHYAVQNRNITTEVLELLKEVYPKGLSSVLSYGDTLLHHALESYFISEAAVEWVMENCPVSFRAVNNELQYPLHVATGWHLAGSSFLPKIVKRLLKEFPPAARFPDKDGTLPVHNAAYYGKVDDIEVILNAFPEAIRHRTNDGRLPLHFACCAESSNEKLDFLIEKYPEGLTVYDKAGYLPFHSIFLHEESNALAVTMMELMIQRMGCATLPPTKAGVPPLLKACENDVELDVIWKLVQHSPELFHVPNTRSPFKERRVSN